MSETERNEAEATTEAEWTLTHEDLECEFIAILPFYRPWSPDHANEPRHIQLTVLESVQPADIPEVRRLAGGTREDLIELLVRHRWDRDESERFVDTHIFGQVIFIPMLVADWMQERMMSAFPVDHLMEFSERKLARKWAGAGSDTSTDCTTDRTSRT